MKSIRFTIACGAVAMFASTTARADEYDEEEEEIWCSEDDVWISDGSGGGDDGGEDGGAELGWGWVEWITTGDPGSCMAESCRGHCNFWVYPCETGQCGDIIWSSCFAVDCYDFDNCA